MPALSCVVSPSLHSVPTISNSVFSLRPPITLLTDDRFPISVFETLNLFLIILISYWNHDKLGCLKIVNQELRKASLWHTKYITSASIAQRYQPLIHVYYFRKPTHKKKHKDKIFLLLSAICAIKATCIFCFHSDCFVVIGLFLKNSSFQQINVLLRNTVSEGT